MGSPKPSRRPDSGPQGPLRINRFLASCGAGSRRACEAFVLKGRVRIDGAIVRDLSTTVSPGQEVLLNGKPVTPQRLTYLLLNKPRGVVCTSSDPQGRPTCLSLVPQIGERVYNVGRLDLNSEGLLILTNDGRLANRLSHPRYRIEKEYEVQSSRPLSEGDRQKMLGGLREGGEGLKAESLEELGGTRYRMVLAEGRNRHIRRMFKALACEVKRLRRVRYDFLNLRGVKSGAWRVLSEDEVRRLYERTGLDTR